MNTKKHVAIIVVLIAFIALLPDVAGVIWSGAMEAHYKSQQGTAIYHQGEYSPTATEAPKSFKFVAVVGNSTRKEEIYITKFGDQIKLIYVNGELKSIEQSSLVSLLIFLCVGISAIGLVVIGSLRRIGRTGKLISSDFERGEIIMMAYGFSLFAALIIIEIKTKTP